MFRISRIRSGVTVLVALASVSAAIGAVTPAAQSRPNDGGYKKSAEAKRKQRQCDDLHGTLHNVQHVPQADASDNLGRLVEAASDPLQPNLIEERP